MPNIRKVAGIEFERNKKEMKESFVAVIVIAFFMLVVPLIIGLVEAL